ncbi:MAG TPA: hypothetical protein VLR91_06975, partial [Thermodesulfobacteriota bacterium]|nr:hypothetical protein [Thermodesulfobacteriota bacterium]
MKKIMLLFTGAVFVLGVMLPMSYAQYKKEKNDPLAPIPKQNTIHLEKTDDKVTKEMQKDIKAIKGEPATPEKNAVTATPPAPADTKTQADQPTKKDKQAKKSK